MSLLRNFKMSPETRKELHELIGLRATNVGIAISQGLKPIDVIMAEVIVLECKVDALMRLMEDRNTVSYESLDEYIFQAARNGKSMAEAVKEMMGKAFKKQENKIVDPANPGRAF